MRLNRYASVLVLALSVGACAQLRAPQSEDVLVVVGEATVLVPPEFAKLGVAVNTEGATPVEALAANNQLMNAVRAAIRELGISADNVETSEISVQQGYPDFDRDGLPIEDATPYEVTNDVSIRVDDLGSLERVIGALVSAGANQVRNVTFEVGNPGMYVACARDDAICDAAERARAMAAAAGVTLGRIVRIEQAARPYLSEAGTITITGSLIAGGPSLDVPISPSNKEFSAAVNVTYAIQ
jgi:uncharacterized protein YggE